jgi:AraC-like DNA-binding protein
MSRLLGHSAELTNCEHLGLVLSRSVNLGSMGLVGRLARFAPTVEAALDDLCANFAVHDTGGVVDVRVEHETATFTYAIPASGVAASEQIYDLAAGVMCNVLLELCGVEWRPTLVMLPRKPPRNLAPYRATFDAPLQFDAVRAAVTFPAGWLSQPVPRADPVVHQLLLREVQARMEAEDPLVCGDVRRAIVSRLHEGECSRRQVARILGLHERTLCRRLHSSGTTFQELLDEVRSELAQQLLHDTHASIAKIAQELGFRNSTVMARAFRRWNGLSPREYRNGLRRPH